MLGQIWDGIKSIWVGGKKFVVGVAKAAWEVIKFAVKAAVWVVAGIFTIAGHLFSYVEKILSEFFTPGKVVIVPPKKMLALVGFLENEAEKGGIAEDPEIMVIKAKVDEAVDKGHSFVYAVGIDNKGDAAISDPEFISAEQYDQKIADAEKKNQIYVKNIRMAN